MLWKLCNKDKPKSSPIGLFKTWEIQGLNNILIETRASTA